MAREERNATMVSTSPDSLARSLWLQQQVYVHGATPSSTIAAWF